MCTSRAPSNGLREVVRSSSRPRCPSYLYHRPRQQAQLLHTSSNRPAKHRSPYRSITQAELQRIADARASLFPKYSQQERRQLEGTYTSDQQAAIDLGEKAVSPHDLSRGKLRKDALRPKYIDSQGFSRLQPVIDKRPSTVAGEWDRTDDDQMTKHLDYLPDVNKKLSALTNVMLDPGSDEDMLLPDEGDEGQGNLSGRRRDLLADYWYQFKHGTPDDEVSTQLRENSHELSDALASDDSTATEAAGATAEETETGRTREYDLESLINRLEDTLPKTLRDRPRNHPLTAAQRLENALHWRDPDDPPEVSQEIPKIEDPRWQYADSADYADEESEEQDDTGGASDESASAWKQLAKRLGQPVDKIEKYRMRPLVINRVVNQTRLGKIDSQYVLCVVGDENGIVGLGEGKAADTEVAIQMAHLNAVRNMKPIRRYERRTIFGEVVGKVGAVELKLNARPPGYGLRVSQKVYEIAKCAGLDDLQAKNMRSRNPMNVAKATVQALHSQKDPEDVARGRGKKMVDVRKVYYAGLV